jgi:Arc/MetJ-type ribon-helix-helix transcriptional regulator
MLVKFTAVEADQSLLRTVEQLLDSGSYASFSDLCKAALRLMLVSADAEPADSIPNPDLAALRQQVQQLAERLTQLEEKMQAAPAVAEVDPLLSRLAPLLEDF